MRGVNILTAAAMITSCADYPRDVVGVSKRIATTRTVRVGTTGAIGKDGARFLNALSQATDARIARTDDALEALVEALHNDQLDVIVSPVRSDSLLAGEIALTDPIDGSDVGDRPVAVRAGVRNGENRWLMTVEHVSRRVAGR